MARSIIHRGPDDEGFHIDGPIGLGFRRLSIIDLSGGHQPMSNEMGTVWVIFNGEIYNFPELRKTLEAMGHAFRTQSDTEVIVHGYEQWGTGIFERLNGMFGLGIWDSERKRLILSRDPMGIKLVYYLVRDGRVFFGSEIRAILSAFKESPDIDPVSMNLFLRYRYTPSPMTIMKGIRKLAPGTMLIFENGKSRMERWYTVAPVPFSPQKSLREAKEELLEIYKKALKRHLLSDVPVGLLLSGGIDSGLLLGLMDLEGESWPTYTIGYGKSFADDELEDAEDTAAIFHADHTSIRIDRQIYEAHLPKIISFLEEPIASSSIVPMYFVCSRAVQDVKVALIGQGPDELFGGYTRHLGVRYGNLWRKLPGVLKSPLVSLINRLPRGEMLKRGIYSLDVPDRMKRYQYVFSIAPGETIDGLFREDILPVDAGDKVFECWKDLIPDVEQADELGGLQLLELRSSLPDELLMYGDKLSMAHSLEVRVPYLDREIVEYVMRLDETFKVRNGSRKWLHRKVCKDFLPKRILKRKKRGFAVNVVDQWFRTSMDSKMENYLSDNQSLMYQYLRPESVRSLLADHVAGHTDNHKLLFSLVLFEEWLRSVAH